MGLTAGIVCLSFLFLQDYYLKLLLVVYPSYQDTDLLEGGTSIISIARCIAVLVLAFMYKDKIVNDKMNVIYVKCNTLALLLYVFCSFIPVISRIGYYLTVTQILLVPAILESIEDVTRKKLYKLVVLIACLLYFLIFMWKQAPADGVRILPYETFLLHDMVPLEYQILD
jgi:hypothetical protein